MSYIYLASPYSHNDPAVRQERYKAAADAVNYFALQGQLIFSSIVAHHHFAKEYNLGFDADVWKELNYALFAPASEVYVLELDGWRRSKGVAEEIVWARQEKKPVFLVEPSTFELYRVS